MNQTNGNKVPTHNGQPIHLLGKKQLSRLLVKTVEAVNRKSEVIEGLTGHLEDSHNAYQLLEHSIAQQKLKIRDQQNIIAKLQKRIIDRR